MKIAIFNGSPKGRSGNTHILAREFLSGAREAGGEGEEIFLSEKDIHHCNACFACWRSPSRGCAINDDMARLLDEFMTADLAVVASPVHFGGVTGLMKNFIDRLLPLVDPHMRMDEQGVTRHLLRASKHPDLFILSNCAFPEPACFTYFRSLFDFLREFGGFRIRGEIFLSQGVLLGNDSPLLRDILADRRSWLRRAGREIVMDGSLSEETRAALSEPLLPRERYLDLINNYWDRNRAE